MEKADGGNTEVPDRKTWSSGVLAIAFALVLHAVAVAAMVISIRSTVDLLSEISLAGLAGSTFAILGAMILTPMIWRFRIVLATAIVAGVVVGTWFMSEADAFDQPWPNSIPMGGGRHDPLLASYDAARFFWTCAIAIVVSAVVLVVGSWLAKFAAGVIRERLNSRIVVLLGAAAFLMIVFQLQSFVMTGGLFQPGSYMRWTPLVGAALIFVLAPCMTMYWPRSGVLACLGSTLVLMTGMIAMCATSTWFIGESTMPQGTIVFVVAVSLSVFTIFFVTIGLFLRDAGKSRGEGIKLPGRTAIGLAMIPAIAISFAGLQFSARWDGGSWLRDRDWAFASALARAKSNGICLRYENWRQIILSEKAKPDALEQLFADLSESEMYSLAEMGIQRLRPEIDLTFLQSKPSRWSVDVTKWNLYLGTVNEIQLEALCQPGSSVTFMNTSFEASAPGARSVVNGDITLTLNGVSESDFLDCVDWEKSSCTLTLNFGCSTEQDETKLAELLTRISGIGGIKRCTCSLKVFDPGESSLMSLAKSDIDWTRIQLVVSGSACPMNSIQEIYSRSKSGAWVNCNLALEDPDDVRIAILLLLAYPNSFSYLRIGIGDQLSLLDELETSSGISRYGCRMERRSDTGAIGFIALRTKWLELLTDDEVQRTECLILGSTPRDYLGTLNADELNKAVPLLAKFTRLKEFHCVGSGLTDLQFLQNMPELERLQINAFPETEQVVSIEEHLPALSRLQELVLFGTPAPEVIAVVNKLPALQSLIIVHPRYELEESVRQKIRTQASVQNLQFVDLEDCRDLEPAMLKAHRQRLREQLKRETDSEGK